MRYTEIDTYVKDNNLLVFCPKQSGIYAITVDNTVVYIGQAKNIYTRCCQHIYNTQNAMLNQEKKYLLLLAAQLGGHNIDCIALELCDEDMLRLRENTWIDTVKPTLNILTPSGKQDIDNLKIEDLLKEVRERREEIFQSLELLEEQ